MSADGERALTETGRALRATHWRTQRAAGLTYVTVGDFAWYDHVLTTLAHVGGLPRRFGFDAGKLTLAQYFAMARGNPTQPAMEMTKWFDTNYHYLVTEYSPSTRFGAGVSWLFDEVSEAQAAGHRAKVALVGPLTLLWLGKERDGLADRLTVLPDLLAAYCQLLTRLKEQGVEWVQIDEPVFALDLPHAWRDAASAAYEALARHAPKLLLATYFDDVSGHAALLKALPVAGLHIDLVRAPSQLDAFIDAFPADKVLSCGIVDGRNVWRNDLDASLARLVVAHERLGERLWVGTSCSLLHTPVDLANEAKLDAELRAWLAFAVQKVREVALLRDALTRGRASVAAGFDDARAACAARRTSTRIHNPLVKRRVEALTDADAARRSSYQARAAV